MSNIINSLDSLIQYLPTLKCEQYRKINIIGAFESAFQKSKIEDIKYPDFYTSLGGVVVSDLESFKSKHSDIATRYFGKSLEKGAVEQAIGTPYKSRENQRSGLVDINTKFARCGRVVYIENDIQCDEVINIDINHKDIELGRRDIVIVGRGAKATINYIYQSSYTLLNRVCEIYLEDNAQLEVVEQNVDTKNSITINNLLGWQQSNTLLTYFTICASANIMRNNIKSSLLAKGAECRMFGANLVYDNAVVSNNTVIEHIAEGCVSDEHFKNVVADSAISDFSGVVFVNNDAQQTFAEQRNDNILLTDTAKAFTRPQLEIYADDVKCSHGATVGELNNEALFYMMQRGISKELGSKLLLGGFLNEIVFKISNEELKNAILDKFENSVKL